jgi:hypothetical protein
VGVRHCTPCSCHCVFSSSSRGNLGEHWEPSVAVERGTSLVRGSSTIPRNGTASRSCGTTAHSLQLHDDDNRTCLSRSRHNQLSADTLCMAQQPHCLQCNTPHPPRLLCSAECGSSCPCVSWLVWACCLSACCCAAPPTRVRATYPSATSSKILCPRLRTSHGPCKSQVAVTADGC